MKDKLTLRHNPKLKGKTVLVTGAGGTIGSGIVASMIAQGANVVAVDISEYAIYKLNRDTGIRGLIGDVADKATTDLIFDHHDIDIVFHCAAYKHIDIIEENSINFYTARKNNIHSTQHLLEYEFDKFVFVSTDKAVHPTCVMGQMKQELEQLVTEWGYTIVRFGNVYDSSGSFIETMREQIKRGDPVTITHPDMARFFITINDAVALINEVIRFWKHEGTFTLDMGEEIRIVDLVPDGYPIEYIGVRSGEKLHEQLVADNETIVDTEHPLIKRIV